MNKTIMISAFMFMFNSQALFAEDRSVDEMNMTTVHVQDKESRLIKSGFYIEPLLSISQEDSSINSSQLPLINEDTSGNTKGYGIGIRWGAHLSEVLLLGLDTRYSRLQTDDSFYNKADADVYNLAPMIALQTPLFGLRLLASYVVAGENNPTAGIYGLDLKYKEAQGWRVGAGLYVASVSVNLEYQDLNYNSTEIEAFGTIPVNSLTSLDAKTRGYTLSLSFPIEL